MKNTLLITLFCLTSIIAFTQPSFDWVNTVGGTANEYGFITEIDHGGNPLIGGFFENTVDFDPGVGVQSFNANGSTDVFIQKFNSNGTLLWVRTFGGIEADFLRSMSCDMNGDIYLTGTFRNTVDFDPGAGVANLSAIGGDDIFVVKLNSNGNYLWAKTIGSFGNDIAFAITCDLNNNLLLTGAFQGTVDFDPGAGTALQSSTGGSDIFTLKLDEDGNYVWVKTVQGSSSTTNQGLKIASDVNGDVITVGWFASATSDFDPGIGVFNLSTNGGWDAFIQKLDQNGNFLWAKSFGGAGVEQINSLVIDDFGNIITAGFFQSTVDFDPNLGVDTRSSAGGYDVFVHKLSTTGNLIWVSTYGGISIDNARSLSIDSFGNIFVTGLFGDSFDFDPGPGINIGASQGSSDIFIQKFDGDGNFVWNHTLGGTEADAGYGCTVGPTGALYIAGSYQTTVDFDIEASVFNQTSNGFRDVFLLKLQDCVPTASSETQIVCSSYTWNGTTYNSTGTYTYVTTNAAGCDSTATLNLTIEDVTAPVPNMATLSNVNAECSVTSLTAPTATDNCAGTITATHNATLPITTQGTTVVTWTYDDGNGNTSTQTQNVVIDDVTAPVANIASLPNVTAQCQVTSLTAPTATDNCAGTITGTHNATLPITTQGTTVVTWTYNDGNGNTSTQTQNVVIDDVTAPVENVASLSNITSECSVTSLTAPTATDNCGGTITGTHNATLPITTQGTTVVTWTYNDGNGNTSTQTQNVVIDDVTAPLANVASLSNITSECSVTSLTAPTATDNCAGTITGTHNATLPITTQGTTVVTWTYNDGNGNTSTQTQNIVITDVTAPNADMATLSDITSECEVTSLTAPTATDNCTGTITGTHNVTLPITTQGTTVVTWTYDDGNGNTSSQTQNVVIDDVTAPVANVASLSNITAECSVTSLTAPTATDNCAGTITGTHNATLPITTQGTTVVTWTYNDGNGNTSTQTQNVIVSGPNVDVTQIDAVTLSADLSGANYQWIDCANGNQPINGETNQIFVATANGNYAVIVDNGTCADTSVCFTISTVGIDANEVFKQVKVYPNPTNGVFTIDLGEQYEQVSIRLMNNLGQLIQEDQYKSVDKLNLIIHSEPGVYFLEGHINQTQQFRINLFKQ